MNKQGQEKENFLKKEPKSFKLYLRKKKQAQIKMLLKWPLLQCKPVNKYSFTKETFSYSDLRKSQILSAGFMCSVPIKGWGSVSTVG